MENIDNKKKPKFEENWDFEGMTALLGVIPKNNPELTNIFEVIRKYNQDIKKVAMYNSAISNTIITFVSNHTRSE